VFRENKDVVVPFNVTLKNVGNSPARNVVERFEVQVLEQDKVFDAIPDQKRLCQLAGEDAERDQFRGKILFPNDEASGSASGGLTAADFKKAWPSSSNVVFRIVGCVDYIFAMDSRIHGQIGASYILARPIDQGTHSAGFDPAKPSYAIEDLILEPDFFHGGYMK